MLTPEEKRRIEDDERKRIAEEQYRAEVRAKLQGEPPLGRQDGSPRQSRSMLRASLAVAVLIALLASAFVVLKSMTKRPLDVAASTETNQPPVSAPIAPSIRYVPIAQQVASGQVVVPARGYVQYRIEIPPAGRDAHVSGSFNASGGRGNDVDAALASESEFVNWINGHQAHVFYGTAGKKTTDVFDVRLGPGTYVFAISNRFSGISSKYVFLDVKLKYQRMETY